MKAFCIKCQDTDAVVCLDLDGSDVFRCQSCEEEFTRADVETLIEGMSNWPKLLKWMDAYPKDE